MKVYIVMSNTDLGQPPLAVFEDKQEAENYVDRQGEDDGLPRTIIWPEGGLVVRAKGWKEPGESTVPSPTKEE
jgi:hypothetical protein